MPLTYLQKPPKSVEVDFYYRPMAHDGVNFVTLRTARHVDRRKLKPFPQLLLTNSYLTWAVAHLACIQSDDQSFRILVALKSLLRRER